MPQADQTPVSRESLERDHAALFTTLRTEFFAAGVAAETTRVKAVLAEGEGFKGHQALVMRLAVDGTTTGPEAAQAILAADRQALQAAAKAHADDAPGAAPASPPPAGDNAVPLTKADQTAKAKAHAQEKGIGFLAALKQLGYAG